MTKIIIHHSDAFTNLGAISLQIRKNCGPEEKTETKLISNPLKNLSLSPDVQQIHPLVQLKLLHGFQPVEESTSSCQREISRESKGNTCSLSAPLKP